ncbi:MAG: signal peptidase I [Patescibacteria group bacterium]|nr:signal peptidase I [Patescibacteria group bacterium]MDD5294839.1 signal peptidase I [Patescibacteria group bacterium]MDD5554487.1 signal peptidase I [Patescibacteria group bacterium]
MLKGFFSFIFELIKIIVISLVIIIPIRYFLVQPFYVKGASMEPNFYDQEYLIIDEISYRFSKPERGDIIVFRYPKNPQEFFIKRIIGLPGEKIQIKDGQVRILNNGNPDSFILKEPYLASGTKTYSLTEDVVSLGEEEYFVLGDNRNSSKDSRSFGPVNRSFVTGKVVLRGWPFSRITLFKLPQYQY